MSFRFFRTKKPDTADGTPALSFRAVFGRAGFKVAAIAALVQVVALAAAGSVYLHRDLTARDDEAQQKALTPGWLLINSQLTLEAINDLNTMRAIIGPELVEATVVRVVGYDGEVLYSTNSTSRGHKIRWFQLDWLVSDITTTRLGRSEIGGRQFMTSVVPFQYAPNAEFMYPPPVGEHLLIYTKIDVTNWAMGRQALVLRIIAAGALGVTVTTFVVWAAINMLLLKRVRAAAQYFRRAAEDSPSLGPPRHAEDDISAIEETFHVLMADRQAEKKRLLEAETRLEFQIREAKSIAGAQSEIRQVRSLIEAMQSGILALDDAGWVSSCDDLAARQLGEKPEAIVHQPLRAFLRRETSAPDAGVFSIAALSDWPPGTHRCRVVSPAGDGDAVEIVVSDAEAENGRRVVLIRDAGDEALRQEIGELAKAIEQTMGPSAHNLGSLRERLAVLREYVAGLESDKQLVSAALDRVPVALAVVDKLGNIRHLNHAAQAIIGSKDGLSSVRGRLIAARREEQARLQQRLTGLLEDRADGTSDWAALQVEREAGTPWLVLLTPLREMAAPRSTATKPADLVIVMITDPLQPVRASVTVLQQLHGLTPAESEVLGRLTDGMRLSDIAEDLGVGIETVRTQLKSIFGKTGTSRQAELVRYALLGGAWIHGTELAPALTDRTKDNRTQRLEDR